MFLTSDKSHIDLSDFQNANIELSGENKSFNELFSFHMQIAIDNQLIGTRSGLATNLEDIGVSQSLDGIGTIIITPIRLTQKGHDFAYMLNNKEVLSKLKSEFKDAPFKVVFEGGQKLLQHYMAKKLDNILE